jgi:hypothetical protein
MMGLVSTFFLKVISNKQNGWVQTQVSLVSIAVGNVYSIDSTAYLNMGQLVLRK